jgi:hypothetical protein
LPKRKQNNIEGKKKKPKKIEGLPKRGVNRLYKK